MQKAAHEQARLRGEGAQARERHAKLTHEVMQARQKRLTRTLTLSLTLTLTLALA